MADLHDPWHEDKLLKNALASIRDLAIAPEHFAGVEGSINSMRDKLFAIDISEERRQQVQSPFRSAIRRISGQTIQVEAVIDWLARTGRFDKKKVQRIRRVKLFKELKNGKVILRDQPISEAWAAVASALVCLLAGAFISWVWLAAEGNIQLILLSFGFGIFFGSLSGMILDRSFRFAKLKREVLDFAPWLEAGAYVRSSG